MALLENQLVVKASTLPGSGNGLFTKKFIPRGTRIVEYKGRMTTWNEVKNDADNGYIYTIDNQHVVDAKNSVKTFGRYANDARGLVKIKGVSNNSTYVNDGYKVFIESIKDIPAGGEILVSYGKDYWDVIRQNRKIDLVNQRKRTKAKKRTGLTNS
jgi:SET domain-containing protein